MFGLGIGEVVLGERLRKPNVLMGFEGFESFFCLWGKFEAVDKLAEGFFANALSTGEGFEFFIGFGDVIASHDGLNGFGEDFGVGGEVFL